MSNSSIEIFTSKDGQTEIQVRFDNETVWINQYQLEDLFQTERSAISKHISNIYRSKELAKDSTCAKIAQVQIEGNRTIKRQINSYNLDLIIAVGYRVNSKRGTEFRIWANRILKQYLINGFVINESRLKQQYEQLKQLQKTVKILGDIINQKNLSSTESIELLKIISDYSYALDILDRYDYQTLEINNISANTIYQLSYDEAIYQISIVKKAYGNSELFGREKDKSFRSSISTIYQTFDGIDLYPSIEEKAANLLYLITKNHSFTDGNKRIAAFIFLYFLDKNKILFDQSGNKRIRDNTLVALTLMIAVSKTEEKDTMIKVVVSLINKNN